MMSEADGENNNTPDFMQLMSEVPARFMEIPTSELPTEIPQRVVDALAEQIKAEGDKLYREGKWSEARDVYKSGIGLRPSDPDVRKATLLNLAATNLQLKDWGAVIRETAWVLGVDPNSVKALYRAARALTELGYFPEALDCCDRALKLEPHNQPLREERHTARKGVMEMQQAFLLNAYQHNHLLITPTEEDQLIGPSFRSSLLPYFDPPLPEYPSKATLFCTLSIAYPERCAADSVADFPFNKPILPLLDSLLPGSNRPKTLANTPYDLVFTLNSLDAPLQTSESFHPTIWDPKYEFTSSSLLLFAATMSRKIIPIIGEMTLFDVCAEARQLSSDSPNQDKEYIEITGGMITVYALRQGSTAQKRFLDELDFECLADLADPGEYWVEQHQEPVTIPACIISAET
ncbi:hypothetical protein FRC09_005858 [Ceratobasidium sp. 395]|nr:hypothetical protein FRC09_005858 [Ceratobasidium sp. 395]